MNKTLAHIIELGKLRISISVALTTFTGYIMHSGQLEPGIIWASLGIFLLSMGSAALNHYQEIAVDKKMPRTQGRPLPTHKMTKSTASQLIVLFVTAGTGILLLGTNLIATAIGLLTLVWYNTVYTPLKKITAFAVVPGSMVGALPPIAGWAAAGGFIFDKFIILVAFFFFIAQIPHFWLLLLKYGNEYEKAGLPSLTTIFNSRQMRSLTFVWFAATAVTALLIPFYGIMQNWVLMIMLLSASVITVVTVFRALIISDKIKNSGKAFMQINLYFLSVMIFIWADQLIR